MNKVKSILTGGPKDVYGKGDYESRKAKPHPEDVARHEKNFPDFVKLHHPGHSYVPGSQEHREYKGHDDDNRKVTGRFVNYSIKNDKSGAVIRHKAHIYGNGPNDRYNYR